MERKILVSITTTKGSDWRARIEEINQLGLKEIALFPTCLEEEEREKLYSLLEKSSIKSIPYLHLKNDMKLEELDYLVEKYKIKVFSTHTQREYPLIHDYSKYRDRIFIENVYHYFDEEELKSFGGICLDLSHLENDRFLNKRKFEHNLKMIEKYPLGCNHISALKKTTHIDEAGVIRYDAHQLEDFSELDYLRKYPPRYFSPLIAIELENCIEEQLAVKDYLINFLND